VLALLLTPGPTSSIFNFTNTNLGSKSSIKRKHMKFFSPCTKHTNYTLNVSYHHILTQNSERARNSHTQNSNQGSDSIDILIAISHAEKVLSQEGKKLRLKSLWWAG
jgi:hypothetical protein